MTIEWTVLLSVLSVSAAIFFGLKASRRADKADDQKEATDMTTVSVKLDFIRTDVSDIKSGLHGMQDEAKDTRERLVAVEASTKQAHKRIDDLMPARRSPKRNVEAE